MPITRYDPGYDLQEERLERLRELFPEAFPDGDLDWDALRDLLGAPLEEGDEYNTYGLFWPGKRAARRAAAIPPRDALAPASGEGVDEETTRNVFIEGDNLEVLKLLRKAYAGRVNVIYIDPPYNTGEDRIYRDDFSASEEGYLRLTGQTDETGRSLTSNTKASGRFHTEWLQMMTPRLAMARELLADGGVIFVSIDDREVHALRAVMNEVFGEESFIGQFVWRRKSSISYLARDVLVVHEYILAYGRSSPSLVDRLRWSDDSVPVDHVFQRQNAVRDKVVRAGARSGRAFDEGKTRTVMDKGVYQLPSHSVEFLKDAVFVNGVLQNDLPVRGRFVLGQESLDARPEAITIQPSGMMYYNKERENRDKPPLSLIDEDQWVTRVATARLNELFDGTEVFAYPKPVDLIAYLCHLVPGTDLTVMDFFAGSATTAEAIYSLGRQDGAQRRYICVQVAEPVDDRTNAGENARRLGMCTVAEIGKERIRRVITRMRAEEAGTDRGTPEDLGVRVYKQCPSNYRRWRDYEGQSVGEYQAQLGGFTSPLVDGWDPIGLRTEVMLAQGFPLDSRIARCEALPHNAVDVISHEWCEHRLWSCLDERIAPETIHALSTPASGYGPQDVFVCLDSALSDEARARLDDRCNVVII